MYPDDSKKNLIPSPDQGCNPFFVSAVFLISGLPPHAPGPVFKKGKVLFQPRIFSENLP
jgi:hypothetical protein